MGAVTYMECSARAMTGLDEVFDQACRAAIYGGEEKKKKKKKRGLFGRSTQSQQSQLYVLETTADAYC